MRILLLSCNTGEGHNSTAKAVGYVLRARGVQCDMEDSLSYLSPEISKFICNWHVRIYRYMPPVFDVGYRTFEHFKPKPTGATKIYKLLALGAERLAQRIRAGGYDAVFCSHVFAAATLTEARRKFGVRLPSFLVTTDYTCFPMTDQCQMDGYFIPDIALKAGFVRYGVQEDRIVATGIPVRQEFYTKEDKRIARARLGLPENGRVMLLMGGSMGCGPMEKLAKKLSKNVPADTMIVAICGSNRKLYDSMLRIRDARLRVIGYTDQVPAFMDAADLMVTKPGGLSSTEAANKHLPMVFLNTVGGCEKRNFDFFLSHGYAVGAEKIDRAVALASELCESEQARSEIERRLSNDFTRNSARMIADCVMEAANRNRLVAVAE